MQWNDATLTYLAQLLAFELIEGADIPRELLDQFDKQLQQARHECPSEQRAVVESRARRINDDYYSGVLYRLRKMYWHELEDGEVPGEYLTWNEEHSDAWKRGVAAQCSVRMRYESETSGETERMVDPYKTQGAYAIGYCHLRKEVRMFRFDRVIEIQNTPRSFKRPKDWEPRWKEQQRKQIEEHFSTASNLT